MNPPSTVSSSAATHRASATQSAHDEVPAWRSIVVLALGFMVAIFFWTKPHAYVPPQSGVVMHLPGYVDVNGGFVGTTAEVTPAEHQILPADTEYARKTYIDYPKPDQIFCGIVLSGATQQSIHRPEVCLVAQGWDIINQADVRIPLQSGHILTVRNLTIQRNIPYEGKSITLKKYNMYWFVGENVTTPSHVMRVFLSSWDRIVHNRAHRWAYVTVAAPINAGLVPGALNAADTKALMIQFIQKIVPTFQKDEMAATPAS